ncbi:MAG: hypothetical protein AAFX50_05740, partial [Acidobacteriota bacterium]
MTGDAEARFRRLEEIFHRASKLAPDDVPAYLDDACGDDDELRREVAGLLGASVDAEARLDAVVEGGVAELDPAAPETAKP